MTLEQEESSTIEWLELFFDLVVVAAIAVLAEGLREAPVLATLGLVVLLYGAIWLSWVSVVLYANVAGERTRVPTVVLAMLLLAVMTTTAPVHFQQRANLFAGAFLLVRGLAARGSMRTGRILAGWPLLQFGGLATLWVVAMWVPTPQKYWLWTAGLLLDLAFVLSRGGAPVDRQVERLRRRMRHEDRRGSQGMPDFEVVGVETRHLDERLSLFMIIVLGEAVSQLVFAVASTPWTQTLVRTALLGFLLLVGLWWLTFSYGFTAAPHSRLARLQPRFALPLHLATTFGIVALAAGLGEMTLHTDEPLGELLRWVMCGGLALHFLVTGLSGIAARAPWRWVLGWALPCTLLPLALAALGDRVANNWLTLGLLACVGWMVAYSRLAQARAAAGGAVTRVG
jgi:low temperature requirement protein LtrA